MHLQQDPVPEGHCTIPSSPRPWCRPTDNIPRPAGHRHCTSTSHSLTQPLCPLPCGALGRARQRWALLMPMPGPCSLSPPHQGLGLAAHPPVPQRQRADGGGKTEHNTRRQDRLCPSGAGLCQAVILTALFHTPPAHPHFAGPPVGPYSSISREFQPDLPGSRACRFSTARQPLQPRGLFLVTVSIFLFLEREPASLYIFVLGFPPFPFFPD